MDIGGQFRESFPDADRRWASFGIDVSGWQSPTIIADLCDSGCRPDWVIVKVSEGGSYESEEAPNQVADCQSRGIAWGYYHYLSFGGVESETACLLRALQSLPLPTLAPVAVWLDCEDGNEASHLVPGGYSAYVESLAASVEAALPVVVGIYTAAWWANSRLTDGSRNLWCADYSDGGKVWSGYPNPVVPTAWNFAALWQFTSSGPLGSLDLNAGPALEASIPAATVRHLFLSSPMLDGPDVAALQHRLAILGFDPGPVDGWFGPLTAAAVGAFQAATGLVPDGIVGPLTAAALT